MIGESVAVMRADILLSQPNTGRAARIALQAAAGGAALYGLVIALLLWNMNTTLKSDQAALKALRQQSSANRAALRRKRDDAARMGRVNVAPPAGSGTAEFTEELYRLASASGAELESVAFTSAGPGSAPPPPSAAPAPNGGAANTAGPANNPNAAALPGSPPAANGSGPNAAPAGDAASGDDGWKRAPFECNLTGGFAGLQDFLERLTRLPRVVEISGLELRRDRVDTRTNVMRVHLKLSGIVFGQGGKP